MFDITEIQEHNSELLKLLTINLPDMLWVKDLNGTYMYANKAICDGLLMAKDTDEPIGKNDVFFALREREKHKDNPNWHTFGELCFNSDKVVIENNKPMKFEEYGNVKGKMLYLEVYKAPFYDKEGHIIGTVGAGRDITELKKVQLDLEEKNKILALQREQIELFNAELEKRVQEETDKRKEQEIVMIHQSRQAAMGELLESIAHQWRQPLNIIGAATSNIETLHLFGNLKPDELQKKIDVISENIHYMSSTIDDFRNFLNPLKDIETFSLEDSIKQTLSVLRSQMNTQDIVESFNYECSPIVNGIENEFRQVIFIIINNAIDAINVKKEQNGIKQGEISISLENDDGYSIVKISNNGAKIEEEFINSIFDAYFTTKSNANGSGIGLYIAKKIIEKRMNGSIYAQNTEDGTCFTIKIPYISLS